MIGDFVYVIVLVTTCLTLTVLCVPDRGASKYRVFPSRAQSAGEKGDRIVLLREQLFGESVHGDHTGDCGMRSLLRPVGVRAELGGRM